MYLSWPRLGAIEVWAIIAWLAKPQLNIELTSGPWTTSIAVSGLQSRMATVAEQMRMRAVKTVPNVASPDRMFSIPARPQSQARTRNTAVAQKSRDAPSIDGRAENS